MAWRRRTSRIVALLPLLFLFFANGNAWAGDLSTPVRIEIQPRVREAAIGGTIEYDVSLRNALGKVVAAPKQMTIAVKATLPSGQTETRQITIGQGASNGGGAVPVGEAGPIRIGASNPELIGGGVVVFGTPGVSSHRGLRLPELSPSSAPAQPDVEAIVEAAPAAPAGQEETATAAPVTGSAAPATSAMQPQARRDPASESAESRTLMLYAPEAEILADGRNGADVTVYLAPCSAMTEDVVVRLAVTRGHLDPNIVTIPRGECSASTFWRSDRMSMGDATLSVLTSVPRLGQGETIVRSFVPPIHSLRLTPNPAEITLLNAGDVLAELHDDVNDVPVSTDRPMKLTLALREGDGALSPLEITFKKGDSTARAAFRPTYWGKVVIAGQIPFRLEERAEFEVRSGAWIFVLSLFGGLIGGLLAYRAKKENPWRILIGLVTGFALFAFFLLFGAENIVNVTGGLNVLNPVAVFLLSLAGGWAGTNVLAWALKRIGIEA